MHPSGMFLAICFQTKFIISTLLYEELHFIKEELEFTNCSIIRYSNAGDYFAINDKLTILLYDTIYYDTIASFDGHEGLITEIQFAKNDLYLVTSCLSGYNFIKQNSLFLLKKRLIILLYLSFSYVYCWNLQDQKVVKNKSYSH